MPLRTVLANGDVVELIKSRNASPQLSWLGFVVTGKARAAIRRAVRAKERAEVAAIGRKLFEQIVRTPAHQDRQEGDQRRGQAAGFAARKN
jgi:guanosine-3',5'-bis(diphosphate) 3'-pyrophosphohydrolase